MKKANLQLDDIDDPFPTPQRAGKKKFLMLDVEEDSEEEEKIGYKSPEREQVVREQRDAVVIQTAEPEVDIDKINEANIAKIMAELEQQQVRARADFVQAPAEIQTPEVNTQSAYNHFKRMEEKFEFEEYNFIPGDKEKKEESVPTERLDIIK